MVFSQVISLVLLAFVLIAVQGFSEDFEEQPNCLSELIIQKYQLNRDVYESCEQRKRSIGASPNRFVRKVDATFHGHPKPHQEVLASKFHVNSNNYDQTNSLVGLVNKVALQYLAKCPPVIYYDSFVKKSDSMILETLFKTLPISFYHGEINSRYQAINTKFVRRIDNNCKSFILFLSDPLMARRIIGPQVDSRVVLIARSTQWKLRDFLASEKSSNIVNLLVIGESLMADPLRERPYVLYTHKLYSDGLGSNTPVVLTSWIRGGLSRPHVNLFPPKFAEGFAGHSFHVSAANQPPFIFRIRNINSGGNTLISWDGIEYRLLHIIAKKLNFSVDINEVSRREDLKSTVDMIQYQIMRHNTDIGMSGIYVTDDRITRADMSTGHSRDCAAFITLASKALPKYRAIMGPFQWPVWVAVVFIYLGAIFPIVFTDRLTLSHLIGNWSEMENMFWYVFGMFTNSLTFSGKYSWANTTKLSTRLLISAYWLFTIIITACYTGSIIAFVTLPAYPETVDSVKDLLGLFFRVGTLDNGGWETWFQNSTHEPTARLYKKMEFVANFEEGIGNVTQSFFWNYAFLGSTAQLEYLVQSNFSDDNISRRSALHLSEECFALFQIGFMMPRNAVYKQKIDSMILLVQQSGIMDKITNEVKWAMQRSANGKLLQASSSNRLRDRIQEDRQLTTADTEGMFLLMGIGYLLGVVALISEIVGGITNKCRQIIRRSRKSVSSAGRFSSKRTSVGEAGRSESAQRSHEQRKAERRKVAHEQEACQQGFGFREFNLTKKTLIELYGNYYKKEPNYVLQDGKLILETEAISVDSSGSSRISSGVETNAEGPLVLPHPPPPIRSRTKTLLVSEVVEGLGDLRTADVDPQESLAYFDQCLEGFAADSQEDAETPPMDEIEEDAFGSRVEEGPQPESSRMNSLHLFQMVEDEKDPTP